MGRLGFLYVPTACQSGTVGTTFSRFFPCSHPSHDTHEAKHSWTRDTTNDTTRHARQRTACKLHFCMTGCLGFYDLVGKVLVENSGFNQWAETNNVHASHITHHFFLSFRCCLCLLDLC